MDQAELSLEPPKVLTVAGSDSGGAAGLQAVLRTFAALGVYGLSAITAVTAQSSKQVESVRFMTADFVAAQIAAVSHAHQFTQQAIRRGANWHMGAAHGPVWQLRANS